MNKFFALYIALFVIILGSVFVFQAQPSEASGFACPSQNQMTSYGSGTSSASFGTVTIGFNQDANPPFTDAELEDAALELCLQAYYSSGQGAAALAENNAANTAINACQNVPSFGCNSECLPSATQPNCEVTRSIGAVDNRLESRNWAQGTATVTCFVTATVTAEGSYTAICSLP